MEVHQIDCFKINMKFWKFLGVWPGEASRYYKLYSKTLILTFVLIYYVLFTVNFFFLTRRIDLFIEEMIFYFTDVSVLSKVLTFVFMRNKTNEILAMLESDIFQPKDAEGKAIVEKAKKFNVTYYKIVAFVSIMSDSTLLSQLFVHFIFGVELVLPVCSYSFLTESIRSMFIYPLYIYQGTGITIHMLYNVNTDTFFLGLMVFAIAQLDVLDKKLRQVTNENKYDVEDGELPRAPIDRNKEAVMKINQCIIHFDEVAKYCDLIEDVFSVTLFVQFSMASCIICVCLMRFTMPAPLQYYIFLGTYMFVMIIQIMVPCWFGTRIMDKSNNVAFSVYNCDWPTRSRQFKSNMRLFVERTNKPLTITGGKMFCLSLSTFTSIMNSAYSFFTLLQQVKSE